MRRAWVTVALFAIVGCGSNTTTTDSPSQGRTEQPIVPAAFTDQPGNKDNKKTGAFATLERDLHYLPAKTDWVLSLDGDKFRASELVGLMTAREKQGIFAGISDWLGLPAEDVSRVTMFGGQKFGVLVVTSHQPLNLESILERKIAAEKKSTFLFNVTPEQVEAKVRKRWQKVVHDNQTFYEQTGPSLGWAGSYQAFCLPQKNVVVVFSSGVAGVTGPLARQTLTARSPAPVSKTLKAALNACPVEQPFHLVFNLRDQEELHTFTQAQGLPAYKQLLQEIDWFVVEADCNSDCMVLGKTTYALRDGVRSRDLKKHLHEALLAMADQGSRQPSTDAACLSFFSRMLTKRFQRTWQWTERNRELVVQFEMDPLYIIVPITMLGTNANSTFQQVGNTLGETAESAPGQGRSGQTFQKVGSTIGKTKRSP